MTLHVVHLVASFDTGGLQNGVVNLANNMDSDRVRHTVLSLSSRIGMAERLRQSDALTLGLDGKAHRGAWRIIAEKLRNLDVDILHTRNQATWLDGICAARRAGISHRIHGFHGRDLNQVNGLSLARRVLGRVLATATDRFVTLTPSMREEFASEFFISPDRFEIIANGFDLDRFTPRTCDENVSDAFTVATVGRLVPVKNLALLLRGFAAMKSRKSTDRLSIVGDGEQRHSLEELARTLGIAEAVEFEGMVEDPSPVYASADVYVQPSYYEGMSNTIVEAMASGVAVIATDVGGNADVVGRDGSGVLVSSDDTLALAAALDAYRADPEWRRKVARVGQQRVSERFGLEKMVEAYLATYESMVRN